MMDDYISRQAAIDAVGEYGSVWMEYSDEMSKDEIAQAALKSAKQTVVRILRELPDADVPDRKVGKWKGYNSDNPDWLRDDGTPIFLTCSECHGTVVNNGSAHWNFCPSCGADMRGEQDESD